MSESKEKLLVVEDLNIEFRTEDQIVRAVDGLSFHVNEGEILGIVGESGSGKSVTGMSLLRLIPVPIGRIVSGRALFRGRDLLSLPIKELKSIRGKEIGIIFQEPMTALSPLMTVGKQFVETLQLHFDLSPEEAWKRSVGWLEKVGIPEPEERMNSYPFQFSGGMRQRVMIAMTLMLEPSLIIADEPTTALDVTTQRQIFELILRVRSEKSAIIFITHDMGVIWQLCDRVMVMEKSRKVEEGELRQIFGAPVEPYTKTLLRAVPRLNDEPRKRPVAVQDEPLLQVRDLRTWFPIKKGIFSRTVGHVKAVDEVSFTVRQGETLALVGESGSGKSTIGRTILGLEKAQGGSILYRGQELLGLNRKAFLPHRRNLQVVFQDPFSSLNPRLTVLDILTEGLEHHGLLQGEAKTDIAARLMEEVGLKADQIFRYPHEFSGGQRQRICIARAISLKPEFVILDEAVSALDVTIQAQVIDLLMELQDRLNLSYLFISHDLSVVKRISDRTIVLRKGKIVEQGETQQVIGDPQHDYTQRLLQAVPIPGDESCRLVI
ncbi:ABC transporter ATP-binding protein [Pelagicoccus sp. SDUM812003]|uniref:ABC transporter ATP-binding protein n=1 Tax=Pelagicoccus sp. SDUM812003 TaxID=3041267 RepID=UPI00280DCC16|nr:ABC transporter ATP-binding protein [Pelagicoccus sp. SDUM812003]MDQ8202756.1 ABC transporter ATP-binding protein [Pelagicoccus sp. SDUM812003]